MPIVGADLESQEQTQTHDLRGHIIDAVNSVMDTESLDDWLVPLTFARSHELVAIKARDAAAAKKASTLGGRTMTDQEEFQKVLEQSARNQIVTWYPLPESPDGYQLRQTYGIYLGAETKLYLLEPVNPNTDYNLVVFKEGGNCYIIKENRNGNQFTTLAFQGEINTAEDANQIQTLTQVRSLTPLGDRDLNILRRHILERMTLVLDRGLRDTGADAALLSATIIHKQDIEHPIPQQITIPIKEAKPLCVRFMPSGEQRYLGFKPDQPLVINYYEFRNTSSDLYMAVLQPSRLQVSDIENLTASQYLHLVLRSQEVYTPASPRLVPDTLVDRRSLAQNPTYLTRPEDTNAVLNYALQQEGELDSVLILSDNRNLSPYIGRIFNDAIRRQAFDLRVLTDGLTSQGLVGHFLMLGIKNETFISKDGLEASFPRLITLGPNIGTLAQEGVLAKLLNPEEKVVRVGDLIPMIMDMNTVKISQPIAQSAYIT